ATALFNCFVNRQQKIKVDALLAAALTLGLGFANAQIERLIAADVELARSEVGEQLIEEIFDEIEAFGIEGIEGKSAFVARAPGKRETVGRFGQRLVPVMFEPALHVAERVLIG